MPSVLLTLSSSASSASNDKIIGAKGFSAAIALTFALVGSYAIVVAVAK
jgi:hypothetical protein